MKKTFPKIIIVLAVIYIVVCGLLYFFQEKIIFYPEKLSKDFRFYFDGKFEEINIKMNDNKTLNALLFKSDNTKGLIFYLHGNGGSLRSWGEVAKTYTDLDYDVFILDYRGYGKSEGKITSQQQLFQDIQTAYNLMKTRYDENKIIVLGYSVGTGPATRLASTNHPEMLILQAPYFNMTSVMKRKMPVIPTLILRYKLQTNEFIKDCKMPIVIFRGNMDEVIDYNDALELKKLFKPSDTLITLNGQGHNGITDNPDYKMALKEILRAIKN